MVGTESKRGRQKKAIKTFDKGIELGQNVYFALHGKGVCLMNIREYDGVINVSGNQ